MYVQTKMNRKHKRYVTNEKQRGKFEKWCPAGFVYMYVLIMEICRRIAMFAEFLEVITGTINNKENLETARIAGLVIPYKFEAHTGKQASSFLTVIISSLYVVTTSLKIHITIL